MLAAGWPGHPAASWDGPPRSAAIRPVDALLGTCSLPQLRRRTSAKWRTYPADVLPAFVAEMDFGLAPPVTRVVTAAVAIGGPPDGGEHGSARGGLLHPHLAIIARPGRE